MLAIPRSYEKWTPLSEMTSSSSSQTQDIWFEKNSLIIIIFLKFKDFFELVENWNFSFFQYYLVSVNLALVMRCAAMWKFYSIIIFIKFSHPLKESLLMTGLEKSRQVWTNFDISLMQKLVHKMQYFQSVFFQIRYSSRVLNYYSSSPPLSSLLVYNYFFQCNQHSYTIGSNKSLLFTHH